MPDHKHPPPLTRREALRRIGSGFGMMAFAALLEQSLGCVGGNAVHAASKSRRRRGLPQTHFRPRAKNVIFLFMNGGVSQVDSFDPKPMLDKYHGHPLPGQKIETERRTGTLMKSPFSFKKYGQSGMEFSELWPHVGSCADDICMIRSMTTDTPNHEPSLLMMNTGSIQPGRPSLGSWLTYGLGKDNENLPGYVVLCPDQPTVVGPPLWGAAFLPPVHQGTFISDREPRRPKDFDPKKVIPYIEREREFTANEQRAELDLVAELNRLQLDRVGHAPQLESAIESMEIAYRMQTEAPEVFDIRRESEATHALYGPGSTARGCMTAVRLIERGVRIVQVYYGKGDPWDHHKDIFRHRRNALDSDQAFAATIKDLKSRGLFGETLVVCATEFGRTPVLETGGGRPSGRVTNGRDHNPYGFSIWLAGAGIKGGTVYGATDDFGFKAVENKVHVHDLHATILHLMGIDHTKLTYRYSGRNFRLTDVYGRVLHDILA